MKMELTSVLWHEIECGAYAADLDLWAELAQLHGDPVLDLGCGSGRVGLHLARRGHAVEGVDLDPALVAAFNERALGLPARAVEGDAGRFELGREFRLVLAPMQLLQLLDGEGERAACLARVAAHLSDGGLAAFAIVEELPAAAGPEAALPDAREANGWLYSSLPLEPALDPERIVVRRLRQTVSPAGELSEELNEVALRRLTASTLEREARAAGLRPVGRREVGPTDDHVGSTVVILEGGR
jgi:SAM-dependent methyltransferase